MRLKEEMAHRREGGEGGRRKAKNMMRRKRKKKVSGEEAASGRGYFASHGQNVLLGSLHPEMSRAIQKPTPWQSL